MGWKEYYQTYPESFCSRFSYGLFKRVLEKSSASPLSKKPSLKLLLGGFSPNSSTANTFVDYCAKFRPDQEDEIYLLDLNHQPFKSVYFSSQFAPKKIYQVQADLTKMPFANNSLDLIFLDGTTMFMKDEEVGRFGQEANRTLSRFGLIVNFLKTPLFDQTAPISNFRGRVANRVPIFFRSKEKSQQLLSPLETVICFDCQGRIALIMGKKDNPLPKDPEYTYVLEPACPKFSKEIS
ncbi:MAG: hypothetical protein XD98_0510 [Microgenomates bacterium 39_6]|nr:MAG: hypothetical protein XD98_0510 [Microgenomates bacterium 39_6]